MTVDKTNMQSSPRSLVVTSVGCLGPRGRRSSTRQVRVRISFEPATMFQILSYQVL